MKKSIISLFVGLYIILGGIVFSLGTYSPVGRSIWTYNPISGFYEERDYQDTEDLIILNTDFYGDSSFQKFLDDKHPLTMNNKLDIVRINSDFTSNKSSDFYLRKEAAEAFEKMAWAFSNAFNFKARLTINSARRSQDYQRKLANSYSNVRCAKPGTSEHEAGLALDLGVNGGNINALNGKYYQWLKDNAHLYGFHNTYQKGMEVDGKMVEPWHWRYVGVELATILHKHNQTFSEFFYENVEKNYNF